MRKGVGSAFSEDEVSTAFHTLKTKCFPHFNSSKMQMGHNHGSHGNMGRGQHRGAM